MIQSRFVDVTLAHKNLGRRRGTVDARKNGETGQWQGEVVPHLEVLGGVGQLAKAGAGCGGSTPLSPDWKGGMSKKRLISKKKAATAVLPAQVIHPPKALNWSMVEPIIEHRNLQIVYLRFLSDSRFTLQNFSLFFSLVSFFRILLFFALAKIAPENPSYANVKEL